TTQSKVLSNDFNNDGWADLLITGRAVPWNYGAVPRSFLLLNKGDGTFKDVTTQWSKELAVAGMVTDAFLIDLNNDQKKDIVICSEWGTIDA
ncbi:FG-GAP repeat domain-containing protein, partial [Staphylococcus aureus]